MEPDWSAHQIQAFGSADKYVAYLQAKALLNWNGQQPQVVVGGSGPGASGGNGSSGGAGTNLIVPLPMPTLPGTH